VLLSDPGESVVLLAALRSLADQARANGDTFPVTDARSHYWFGVAVGYDDAAERLEDNLRDQAPQSAS
jgi:hypothetical protein